MAADATTVMVVEWCLYMTMVFLACCRFGVHIQKKTVIMFISDIWLLIAVLDCTALIACDTVTYREDAMNEFLEAPEIVRKLRFATIYLFDGGLCFPKFSMLAFYIRVIPPTSPKMRKGMWAVVGFVTASAITSFFAITFWCGTEQSVNWSGKQENCSVFSARPLAQLNWSLNIISEVLIFLLPLPLISSLHFRYRREKAGLLCMFLLGGLTISASVARFIVQDQVVNNLPMYILAMTEYTISVIIISCLSLRPILRKIYRVATDSGQGSSRTGPFSRSTKIFHRSNANRDGDITSTQVSVAWRKGRSRGPVYTEDVIDENGYGSEVELTELEMGRIYKTEEVIVTGARDDVSVSVSDDERSTAEGVA